MSAADLEVIRWRTADGQGRTCPHFFRRLRTCKRRDCDRCGRPWARSIEAVIRHALIQYGGEVSLVTITPPGQDVLPWACDRDHEHSGTKGCKVDNAAADDWSAWAQKAWPALRDAARKACVRDGWFPALLVRTWEPQKRDVPHIHLVLGMGNEVDRIATRRFVAELKRLCPEYGFGWPDRKLQSISAREAAGYLAGYLTGRAGHKESIRANIADPRMPRSLVWVNPALTSLSNSERLQTSRARLGVAGGSGVTMRALRLVRWYFAALRGRVSAPPALYGQDAVDVATVASRLEPKRARAPDESDDARQLRHLRNLRLMRQLSFATRDEARLYAAAA